LNKRDEVWKKGGLQLNRRRIAIDTEVATRKGKRALPPKKVTPPEVVSEKEPVL